MNQEAKIRRIGSGLIEEVAQQAADIFKYGDMIPHSWILNAFRLEIPEEGTREMFRKAQFEVLSYTEGFKEDLLERHKMYLKNVRGEGYLVIKPAEQTDTAMEALRDGVRTNIRKAMNALTNVNEALLTIEEMRYRDEATGKIAALSVFSKNRLIK